MWETNSRHTMGKPTKTIGQVFQCNFFQGCNTDTSRKKNIDQLEKCSRS